MMRPWKIGYTELNSGYANGEGKFICFLFEYNFNSDGAKRLAFLPTTN